MSVLNVRKMGGAIYNIYFIYLYKYTVSIELSSTLY